MLKYFNVTVICKKPNKLWTKSFVRCRKRKDRHDSGAPSGAPSGFSRFPAAEEDSDEDEDYEKERRKRSEFIKY